LAELLRPPNIRSARNRDVLFHVPKSFLGIESTSANPVTDEELLSVGKNP